MFGPFPRIESQEFRGMGTQLGILIVVTSEAEAMRALVDITLARGFYTRYEKIFSRFDPESELSHINAHLGQPILASPEMRTVATRALHYARIHEGLYDPRIITILEKSGYARDFHAQDFTPIESSESLDASRPLEEDLTLQDEKLLFQKRMDFAGIVKGHVTDVVSRFLHDRGWRNFLVDSGGDMYASGRPHDSDSWHIAIEGAETTETILALSDTAVATSGINRRQWHARGKHFHHLIHPQHPDRFTFEITTLSVIASSTEEADVLAKTLFIRDETDRRALIERDSLAVCIRYADNTLWLSPAAQKYCVNFHSQKILS